MLLIGFLFFLNISFASSDEIKPLILTIDHGTPIRLPEPAATIAIGNPNFFNVVTLDNNFLMLTGEREGVTSMTIFGKSGQIYQYRVQVSVDIQQLKEKLQRDQIISTLEVQMKDIERQRHLQKLRDLIQPMEPNVTVDDLDGSKVILRGEVQSPAALVRVLTIADRFFGGNASQPDFKVISDYGGVLAGNLDEAIDTLDPSEFRPLTQQASGVGGRGGNGGRGGAGNQRLLDEKANLAQNISRASVVSVANGRILSLIKVISQPKIEIQMRLIEIDRSKTDEFGIDWRLDGNKVSIGSLHGSVVSSLPSPSSNAGVNVGSANLVGFFTPGKYSLAAFVRAVEEKGATSTLSEPLLTAVSGESARFLVGGNVPIPYQETTSSTNSVAVSTNVRYITFGMNITVRPTVLENGKISIILDQTLSEADYTNAIQIIGAQVPGFKQKAVSTITESDSGETWAVAGLLTEEDRKSLKSVPWISKVPILGKLFENKDDSTSRNELIILVNARRVDTPNTTTTNFDGHGKLSPSSVKEQSSDPSYSENPNKEMSSSHLQQPTKGPEPTTYPPDSEKPINLNKKSKDKNDLSTPTGKSKKLAINQPPSTASEKAPQESDAVKIINLRGKSVDVSAQSTQESTVEKIADKKTNDPAQVFSFDTEKILKDIIEKKSSAHIANTQPAIEVKTAPPTVYKVVENKKLLPENESKNEQSNPKVIHVTEVSKESMRETKLESQPAIQLPQEKKSASLELPATNLSTVANTPSDILKEQSKQTNVVVVNFLSSQEKNEYFKRASHLGLTNVPPKSEWPKWKVGIGAIDGDSNRLVRFAVSPSMRSQIYSGATVLVELPKSPANYALDY